MPQKPRHGDREILSTVAADPEWEAVFADTEGTQGESVRISIAWAVERVFMQGDVRPARPRRRAAKGQKLKARPKRSAPRVQGRWIQRTVGYVPVKQDLLPADNLGNFLGYSHPIMDLDYDEEAREVQGTSDKPDPPKGLGGLIN